MMDATFIAVSRLWEQGANPTEISRRLNLSWQKTTKILITIGAIETEESRRFAKGESVAHIAASMEKTENAVLARIPYQRCMYRAEFPSKGALKQRQWVAKKKEKAR